MIVTVTVNAALDVTYAVPRLVPHTVHRVRTVAERAGGKGLNVARLLHLLGEPVTATGLVGGHTGARIAALLADDGVPGAFEPIAGESRRTVVVHADGEPTGFWEPGPQVSLDEWAAFRRRFDDLLDGADVVTLSGSLPTGVPVDGYADLIAATHRAGVPVVLDADGAPLRHGLAAVPTVVKPNADELAAAIGHRPSGVDATAVAAARLHARYGSAVVASLGVDGLVAVTAEGAWHAAAPPQTGNPTGAGDAVTAAVARGLRNATGWPELLADAAALSAATVREPVAGAVDVATYQRIRRNVRVTTLDREATTGRNEQETET